MEPPKQVVPCSWPHKMEGLDDDNGDELYQNHAQNNLANILKCVFIMHVVRKRIMHKDSTEIKRIM